MVHHGCHASQQDRRADLVTTADLVLAVVTTVVGAIAGLVVSYYFFRRGAARPKIIIGMAQLAHIDPSTVG